MIASSGGDRSVRIWDVKTGKILNTVDFDSPVNGIAFSPNKPIIACSVNRKNIELYDFRSKSRCSGLKLPEGYSTYKNLTFSADGSMIAAVCSSKTVRVWDCTAKTLLQEFRQEYDEPFLCWQDPVVALSPDGSLIASDNNLGYTMIWETATGDKKFELKGSCGSRKGLAFSPDGKTIAVAGIGEIKLWDTSTGKKIFTCTLGPGRESDAVFTLAFSPNGATIMMAGGKLRTFGFLWPKEGWISLCDVATGSVIDTRREKLHSKGEVVSSSSDGKTIAFGGFSGTLVLWNWQ
jgi:WD40 repeat protein